MNHFAKRVSGALLAALAVASAAAADPRHDERHDGGSPQASRDQRADDGAPRAYRDPRRDDGPPRSSYDERAPAFPPRRPNSLGADWREQQEEARSGVRLGQMAPLGQVIQGIGRRSAGRPLDAGIEYQGGRPVYRVRWITPEGRRVDYLVDAATGTILSQH